MKVLGIVCSPRKGGNTEIMMKEALTGASSYGAETELWTVAGKDLKFCDGCSTCRKNGGQCHIKDDMQEIYPKILAAEGLIFGSPSYFASVTAQAKTVIDRLYSLYYNDLLVNKVAGVISVAGSRGHEGVSIQFNGLIELAHMFSADYAVGYGSVKGEVRKDDYAMKSAEELGKQIVTLVKQQLLWPEEHKKSLYRSVKDKYGIESYPLRHTRQVK